MAVATLTRKALCKRVCGQMALGRDFVNGMRCMLEKHQTSLPFMIRSGAGRRRAPTGLPNLVPKIYTRVGHL